MRLWFWDEDTRTGLEREWDGSVCLCGDLIMMIPLEHRLLQGLKWIDSQEPVLLTQDRWRILWKSAFEDESIGEKEKVRMSALVIKVLDSIGVKGCLKSACVFQLKVR